MVGYLIDANLPRWLDVWPENECIFVVDLDAAMSDDAIWSYAEQNTLTIVTKDADFADRVFILQGGPSVIHVRVGNMKLRQLDDFMSSAWADVCALSKQHRIVQVFADRIEAVS